MVDHNDVQFDAPTLKFRVEVQIVDDWPVQDVRLISWPDSVEVVSRTQTEAKASWLTPSSTGRHEGINADTHIWHVDAAGSAGAQETYSKWLELTIEGDAETVRVPIRLEAKTRPHAVPPLPPSYIPDDIRRNFDPNWKVPYDIISIAFVKGTSIADRASAIRSLQGHVIGGIAYDSQMDEGFYLVRIPSKGVKETLLPALEFVRRLPQVFSVGLFQMVTAR